MNYVNEREKILYLRQKRNSYDVMNFYYIIIDVYSIFNTDAYLTICISKLLISVSG